MHPAYRPIGPCEQEKLQWTADPQIGRSRQARERADIIDRRIDIGRKEENQNRSCRHPSPFAPFRGEERGGDPKFQQSCPIDDERSEERREGKASVSTGKSGR